jgi:hypothetical protein
MYGSASKSIGLLDRVSIDESALALDLAKARHGIRKLCGILGGGRPVD